MRITISGPPGSGKTTACRNLSQTLGLKAVVFGTLFREMAKEKGLSLSEMGDLAERDPSIDKAIDERLLQIARDNKDIILESRLSAHMLSRNGIEAFKIYLDASLDIRCARVCSREGEPLDEAISVTEKRQASEAVRYMKYYGIDITDMSVYDLVINTDSLTPEQVLEKMLDAIEGWNC
ncbi:MAG: AAA family ATPase [Candidatus Methanomethylophilaceae archaeon]|nr:AAA family ATPase [Candidatus Methanomethylophilaceae archaeon]